MVQSAVCRLRAVVEFVGGLLALASIFADDIGHARHIAIAADGVVYVNTWSGRYYAGGFLYAESNDQIVRDVSQIPPDPSAVEAQMAYVVGASMLVTRRFVERGGLMEESYFLYSEEGDWALRGRRAGFRLGYAPKSWVYHKQGSSIGTSPQGGSDLSLFYLYRAKLMFTRRHYPWLLPSVLAWLSWELCKFVLKGAPGKARAAMRGMLAAWTGVHFSPR
jgi:GT2 family glycosyltransferase